MDPKALTLYEKRLLQPVSPGVLTYLAYASLYTTTAGYGVYIWRGFGYKAFVSKPVIPFIGLFLFSKAALRGITIIREKIYAP